MKSILENTKFLDVLIVVSLSLFLYFLPSFKGGDYPIVKYYGVNQMTRYYAAKNIVERGTLDIDQYQEKTCDWSKSPNGHYYSNKAPGSSLLSTPFYFLYNSIVGLFFKNHPAFELRQIQITNFFVTILPYSFLNLFIFYLLLLFSKTHQHLKKKIPWIVLFSSLGTLLVPFSLTLWGHVTASVCLFSSVFLLKTSFTKKYTYSGLLFSLAVLTEYSAALCIIPFLIYFFNRRKEFIFWVLGGVPGLILFLWYHWAAFGSILSLAPQFQNPALGVENNKILGVLGVPNLDVLAELLFGGKRGLFLITPLYLFSLLGFYRWFKSGEDRFFFFASVFNILLFLFFNSSYNGWDGGHSAGPRYLIPALPFFIFSFCYLSEQRFSVFFKGILIFSIFNSAAISIVNTMTPPDKNLLTEYIYPFVFDHFTVFIVYAVFSFLFFKLLEKRILINSDCS